MFVSREWEDFSSYVPFKHTKKMIHNLTYVLCHDKWTMYLSKELNKEDARNFERLCWCGTFGTVNLQQVLTKKLI